MVVVPLLTHNTLLRFQLFHLDHQALPPYNQTTKRMGKWINSPLSFKKNKKLIHDLVPELDFFLLMWYLFFIGWMWHMYLTKIMIVSRLFWWKFIINEFGFNVEINTFVFFWFKLVSKFGFRHTFDNLFL